MIALNKRIDIILKLPLKLLLTYLLFLYSCSAHIRIRDDGTNIDRANDLLRQKTAQINFKDGLSSTAFNIQIRQDSLYFINQTTYKPITIPVSKIESLNSRSHWSGATEGFVFGMVITGGIYAVTNTDNGPDDMGSLGLFMVSLVGGTFGGLIGAVRGTNLQI